MTEPDTLEPAAAKAPTIPREPDFTPMLGTLVAIAGTVAVLVALAVWTRFDERIAGDRAGRAPPAGPEGEPPRAVFEGPIDLERPGIRAREAANERLRSWAWEDRERGLVRVPIERAIDIAASSWELTGRTTFLPRLERAPTPDDVRVDEKLGSEVPLDLDFLDEQGRAVKLREVVLGPRPTVLVLAYERCPSLCGLVLRGLVASLHEVGERFGLQLGRDYRALVVSIDPRERPEEARHQQGVLLGLLGRPGASASWPFLTGREAAIEELARSVGFTYAKIPGSQDLAHPAVAIVLTPEGKVSRYLYGVQFPEQDVKLSLIEAGQGRSGSSFQRLLLRCYRYDPASHRYMLAIENYLRAGGLVVLLVVGGFVLQARRAGRGRGERGP